MDEQGQGLTLEQFEAFSPRWYLHEALIGTAIVVCGLGIATIIFAFAPLTWFWGILAFLIYAGSAFMSLLASCLWKDFFTRLKIERIKAKAVVDI